MTQNEKRLFLIKYLLNENSKYSNIVIPKEVEEQMEKCIIKLYNNIIRSEKLRYMLYDL